MKKGRKSFIIDDKMGVPLMQCSRLLDSPLSLHDISHGLQAYITPASKDTDCNAEASEINDVFVLFSPMPSDRSDIFPILGVIVKKFQEKSATLI